MDALLVLPVLIPLLTAVAALLAFRRRWLQRVLGVAGAAALMVAGVSLLHAVSHGGIRATQLGGWAAPFGITFVADLFSALMVCVAGLMGFLVAVYSLAGIDARRESFGYYPLYHILLMGVCGAFLTGDIFNLFVWFEVMLIASFVLVSLGGERAQLEGAIKYVTLNLIASALFLTGVGIVYGIAGTLNMADLALRFRAVEEPGLLTAAAMLFFVSFGIKAAIFPLFFWLPASYHTPPVAVAAIFSGLLTKVGIYALVRTFTLLFVHDTAYTHTIILVVAALTMLIGVLGAVAQNDIRRLLSFHIVSQIGYLLMGLGLYTQLGLAGTIFFLPHVILSKSALFLVSGIAYRVGGSYHLKELGGLYRAYPGMALLFLVPAFSLAGMPPLSGFFAKLALVQAGLRVEQYAVVAVALGVGLLTLLSMTKIWTEAFWKPRPAGKEPAPEAAAEGETIDAAIRSRRVLEMPALALALLVIALGLAAEPVFELSLRAAEQLLDPSDYITAVLGGR
jgi:multicomponent Na+:H+ antiporter subunit D